MRKSRYEVILPIHGDYDLPGVRPQGPGDMERLGSTGIGDEEVHHLASCLGLAGAADPPRGLELPLYVKDP